MQSHLGKAQTVCADAAVAVEAAAWGYLSSSLTCEQSVLLDPVERQIEFGQTRRGELDGLPALQDRFDQLRAQEGEANETSDVRASGRVERVSWLLRFP